MSDIVSRPYSTAAACERCVFGRGEHMWRCPAWLKKLQDGIVVAQYAADCTCYLPWEKHKIGEPHATECPLSKEKRNEQAA